MVITAGTGSGKTESFMLPVLPLARRITQLAGFAGESRLGVPLARRSSLQRADERHVLKQSDAHFVPDERVSG